MSEETPTPPTAGYFSVETRKIIPTLVVTVLTALGVSYWNTQVSQSNVLYRLTLVETKLEAQAKSILDIGDKIQASSVEMGKLGQNQLNTLDMIREIKQEQERIRNSLGRR